MRPRRRSRPWLPLWGSWRAISEPERADAVENSRKCGDCSRVPSQSWHQCANLQLPAPSQSRLSAVPALPKGEPRGGRCPPGATKFLHCKFGTAEGKTCDPGGAAALGSPYGGAGERAASLRGRKQWEIWEKAEIATRYPLSHDHHPPSNRVTPNGVGQLPGSQARHSQRVQPALSVTAAPCQLSQRESQWAAAPPGAPKFLFS